MLMRDHLINRIKQAENIRRNWSMLMRDCLINMIKQVQYEKEQEENMI